MVRTALLILAAAALAQAADLTTLDELYKAIESGPNAKLGFLSQANADSVHTVLPSTMKAVVCDGKPHADNHGIECNGVGDIIKKIKDGSLVGGLISGLPEDKDAPDLHTFSSSMVSPRAMFLAPDVSTTFPHGAAPANSSYDLSLAVDAAIVNIQQQGIDEKLRLANMPFEFVKAQTCQGSDLSAFGVANASKATGLLRNVLDTRTLRVGALGPYNWGGNDGNYKVMPYTGFYPAYLNAFCEMFNTMKGADGVVYGGAKGTAKEIKCERVWQLGSAAVLGDLFDGRSDVTEPYYVIDSFYTGTGEACTTDADCRPSHTATGRESCTKNKCAHAKAPRTRFIKPSCTTLGVDSTFMTKKNPATIEVKTVTKVEEVFPVEGIIGIVILGVACAAVMVCAVRMMYKEREGDPIFKSQLLMPTDSSNEGGPKGPERT